MKRTLAFIGFAISLLPTIASAQTPISQHYVQKVLDRVDLGLSRSTQSQAAPLFELISSLWLQQVFTTTLEVVDTQQRLNEAQRDLPDATACLHYDLTILQRKVEQVRGELKKAFDEKRTADIRLLESIIVFLDERIHELTLGALEPGYEDDGARAFRLFDPVTWCCAQGDTDECTQMPREQCDTPYTSHSRLDSCVSECEEPTDEEEERYCPFDSDYLPPADGYGCDLTVLNQIAADLDEGGTAEYQALSLLAAERGRLLSDLPPLGALADTIARAAGRDPPVIPQPSAHRVRIGCNLEDGEQHNPAPEGTDYPWPENAVRTTERGPFSMKQNIVRIALMLQASQRELGGRRPLPEYLQQPGDFAKDSREERAVIAREEETDFLTRLFRGPFRKELQRWSNIITERDIPLIFRSEDTERLVAAEMTEFTNATTKFAQLSSQADRGVRRFTINFAAFLRRSCMEQPCNNMLDRILHMAFTDECFPYANGTYRTNPVATQICRAAAGGIGEGPGTVMP